MHQLFHLLVRFVIPIIFGVNEEGIVVAISVIHADVERTDAVFERGMVIVEAQVQTVVVAHTEIVTLQGLDGGNVTPSVG